VRFHVFCCGADWGEKGYIRLHAQVQSKEGLCGIAMAASYPTKSVSGGESTLPPVALGSTFDCLTVLPFACCLAAFCGSLVLTPD
jgi:hypothetical protein